VAAIEISMAKAWLSSIEDIIGSRQSDIIKKALVKYEDKSFPHKNWKKILLNLLNTDNSLELWEQKFRFANMNDARALLDEIYIDDVYGLRAIDKLEYVIDAGASNGFFAFSVKKYFPDAIIDCIEPNENNIPLINENLATYITSGDVRITAKAIHNHEKGTSINIPNDVNIWGGLGANIPDRERTEERDLKKMQVDTITLSKFLNRKVSLLKCDIEGMEFEVIIEAGKLIKNCERLLIEIHSDVNNFTAKYTKLISFLHHNDFRVFCYEGASSPASFFSGQPSPSFMMCAINNNFK